MVLIIRVEDMPATLERIDAQGGTVTQARRQIGEASPGYDAYFLDPNGNGMGLFSER